ncbi:MAG: phosphoribosylaminoimidazolesuccinocarboxamide synthase [Gammaproteobacteria bacterium]|nr:phosphoribosylaminoimidazolesuccinocarboxamide synthase [Gammaproteobacteria bacterium]
MSILSYNADLPGFNLLHRGKVRDIYELDATHLLIVTSDRISAFDVVLPTPIPGKGEILTSISNFWFEKFKDLVPNHLTNIHLETVLGHADQKTALLSRSVIVRKLNALPVEAIVRGYLIGSGWQDYRRTGMVGGTPLPKGLNLADKLPQAIFTPSTKAAVGSHDINVDYAQLVNLIGRELSEKMRDFSLELYRQAATHAIERGIIIADTKFEFGLDEQGNLVLIDEVITPDSSRFWPANLYRPGISPPSFDKQYVRDYLETLDWDKSDPGPILPAEVVKMTAEKYRQAQRMLIY